MAPLTLIRPPMTNEIERAAQVADRVLLSDPVTAAALGRHVPGYPMEVLLTVDLGDRREGVLPEQAAAVAAQVADLQGIRLAGIAVNFACLSGLMPSVELFRQAEDLVAEIEDLCVGHPILSLGGSCVLPLLSGYHPRCRTEVRAGAAPVFGIDLVSGAALPGLVDSVPTLQVEVLESYRKPPPPPGPRGGDAFGNEPDIHLPDGDAIYTMVAVGRRDATPSCLRPLDDGVSVAGMTSDVAILITSRLYRPGDRLRFALDYEGLVRAVTSPFVRRRFVGHAARASSGVHHH